jgi:hypothetical protein
MLRMADHVDLGRWMKGAERSQEGEGEDEVPEAADASHESS